MENGTNDNYERLEVLRNITKLGPVAYAKVMKARRNADNQRELLMKYEPNDEIGVDYSVANDLEIALREQALQNRVEKDWTMYGDGLSLSEYADGIIEDRIEERHQGQSR